MVKRTAASLVILLIFIMGLSHTASAANDHREKTHRSTTIAMGQTVENVVVFGRDVSIAGKVNDSVIIFGGNLSIESTAVIKGFVFVIGGNVEQNSHADVSDNIVNITFTKMITDSLVIGAGIFAATWLSKLLVSLLLLILAVVTFFLSKKKLETFVDMIRYSPRQLIFIGFFTSLLFIAIGVLLSIIVVGIPVLVLLLLLALIFFFITFTTVSFMIGKQFQFLSDETAWLFVFTGSFFLVGLFNFPFFGFLFFIVLQWLSLGVMTVWLWEKRNWRKKSS